MAEPGNVDANLALILSRFEQKAKPFLESEVSTAIRRMVDERDGQPSNPSMQEQAEVIAFTFAESGPGSDSPWGTYYVPLISREDNEGKIHGTPDIEAITIEMLAYWKDRAQETQQARMKLRYADLVWDLTERVAKQAAPYQFAEIAIKATLEMLSSNGFEYALDAEAKSRRALNLALTLNKVELAESLCRSICEWDESQPTDSGSHPRLVAFDLLIAEKPKLKLDPQHADRIITNLEDQLAACSTGEPPEFDPFRVESVALRLAGYYRSKSRLDDVRRVLLVYRDSWVRMAEGVSAILATGWIRKVHQHLLDFDLRQEATELEPQLRSSSSKMREEMPTVETKASFPKKDVEEWIEAITAESLQATAVRIAVHFLPDPEQAKAELFDVARDFPLQAMFTRRVVDDGGRVVAEVGSLDDDLEGNLVVKIAEK